MTSNLSTFEEEKGSLLNIRVYWSSPNNYCFYMKAELTMISLHNIHVILAICKICSSLPFWVSGSIKIPKRWSDTVNRQTTQLPTDKQDKKTNNDLQNTTQRTREW